MKDNPQIQQEAAEWLVQLNAGAPDAQERAEFDAWLRTSPEHIRAYLELLPTWHDSESLSAVNEFSREELIALATAADSNVVPFSQSAPTAAAPIAAVPPGTAARASARRRSFAIAAGVVAAGVAIIAMYVTNAGVRQYRTETAEIRTLTLEDGTRLSIGAQSAVTVRYSQHARDLTLESGDLYIDVGKDPTRPLTVEANGRVIRALGTQFEVRADGETVRVAVVEGKVAVSSIAGVDTSAGGASASNDSASTVLLSAGQRVTARKREALRAPEPIRSAEPAAWRVGRLVFEDANLGDVVREFNRYNARQLTLVDPSLESMPIAAAFSSSDPASLIRFLRQQPGILVTEQNGAILIESQR